MKTIRVWSWVALLLVVGFVGIASAGSVGRITPKEMASLHGGQTTYWCIFTDSTCTGTQACQFDAATNSCRACTQSVSSWSACGQILDQGYTCTETYNNPGTYCGTRFTGVQVNGACPNGCPNSAGTCAKKIPDSVTGQACPPPRSEN